MQFKAVTLETQYLEIGDPQKCAELEIRAQYGVSTLQALTHQHHRLQLQP